MSLENHKKLVRRYFEEVIDGRADVLDELFTPGCVIHRLELPEPIQGLEQMRMFLEMSRYSIQQTRTTLHRLVAEGDTVAAHLTHHVTFAGMISTPFGAKDVAGQSVQWSAMVFFRIADGKIAEEWVNRDELGILAQVGLVQRP
ncbi:ester cyclase [Stigmatella sp. ncwal1]|uniref:Ester cyclase n=1 Tax=Stigmatella ashevillensis TaxID=2995309 RepID=A0ABT5DAH0_9BACT|nr:ester cyclase [Stigmatella ashevillena]MDC0710662.1 ester cyclase [Stigmatella ashevillena]